MVIEPTGSFVAVTREIPANLNEGRHTIAFACRQRWSPEVSFYWSDRER
jgi:hypothetical protein